MLRPIRLSSLLPALRLISRYSSAYTPTRSTINDIRALPLSDAQRKTIYALSTPPAKSGVAVIRISGPDALHVWQQMVRSTRAAHTNQNKDELKPERTHKPSREPERNDGTSHPFLPEAWKLQRCHVVDPQTSELLDDALAVFFRGAPRVPPKACPSFL
jgi:tRNA modification GTPase